METISYKCPNCGGGLIFSPDTQRFKCEFCLSDFAQQQLEHMEPESSTEQPDNQSSSVPQSEAVEEMAVYNCPSCGAEIVADPTTAATFCYYCHNPVVLSGRLSGEFRPDYVLPFTIDRERAVDIFKGWVGKKKFVPKSFYSKKQIEKMTGVYYPYLLYSCKVDAHMEAEGKNIRQWRSGDMEYTETKVYRISRSGNMDISNITRNALQKAEHQFSEAVMPFDMAKLQPFSSGFLSGFVAEKRDMGRDDFVSEIEQEVKQFATDKMRREISGYDSIAVKNTQSSIQTAEWRYALMPVWTITYKDKSDRKLYYFALNGQTGSICGALPVDSKRLLILFLCIFLPLFLMFLIGGLSL